MKGPCICHYFVSHSHFKPICLALLISTFAMYAVAIGIIVVLFLFYASVSEWCLTH